MRRKCVLGKGHRLGKGTEVLNCMQGRARMSGTESPRGGEMWPSE